MSDLHPTISDKERDVGMAEDGDWHTWQVRRSWDGLIEPDFTPPMLPGDELLAVRTYWVAVNVRGLILMLPSIRRLDVRLDRFPLDPADNGTAWDHIDLREFQTGEEWFGSFAGKIEFHRSGTYSTSAGLGYRVPSGDGTLKINSRIVKLLRQRDE